MPGRLIIDISAFYQLPKAFVISPGGTDPGKAHQFSTADLERIIRCFLLAEINNGRKQADMRGQQIVVVCCSFKSIRKRGMAKVVTIHRSEEHTSELQSLMRNSYAVFCWKNK